MLQSYIDVLTQQVAGDSRINAAWIDRSYRRGTADRYSHLDIHLLRNLRKRCSA